MVIKAPKRVSSETSKTEEPIRKKRKTIVAASEQSANDSSRPVRVKKRIRQESFTSSDDGDFSEDGSVVFESSQYNDRTNQRDHRRILNERMRRTVFVGNLPLGVTRKCLRKLFASALKQDEHAAADGCHIESVRIRGIVPATGGIGKLARKRAVIQGEHSAGVSKALIAYIVFSSAAGVRAALALNGHLLSVDSDSTEAASQTTDHKAAAEETIAEPNAHNQSGRCIRVDRVGRHAPTEYAKQCVFLGNLPFDVLEDEVRSAFSEFGEITNVRVIRDKQTGAVKGFGFLQFSDPSSVPLVIRASGTVFIRNRPIRVQEWKESGETGRKKIRPKVTESSNQKSSPKPKRHKRLSRLDQRGLAMGITLPSNLHGPQREQYLQKRLIKKQKRKLRREKQKQPEDSKKKVVAKSSKRQKKAKKL
ncbi:unnamed protein product [Calicophoron daubneyi]|uniref:RRM domain-containing protein n=1 Tax=Calicophoron daubneyi TaxID=300641 RepID=A0AAV2T9L4_CALDB